MVIRQPCAQPQPISLLFKCMLMSQSHSQTSVEETMDMCQVTYQLNYISQHVESNYRLRYPIPPLCVVLTGGVGKMNGGTLLW